MRSQDQIEVSSAYSNSKKRASVTASTGRNHVTGNQILGSVGGGGGGSESIKSVMEFPDGSGQERHQKHQQHQHQPQQRLKRSFPSQHPHHQHTSQQEARQPQHRGYYSQPPGYHASQQQPPPPPHQAPQPHSSSSTPGAASGYSRGRPDHPPDINMASASQVLDRDYLQQQQRQAQQYLHHHGGHYGAAAGVASYSAQQYAAAAAAQQQHHQQALSYQQQLAMQQQYGAAAAGYPPSMDQHMGHPPPPPPPSHPHHPAGQAQAPSQVLQQPYLQPRAGRLPADRPLIKLSVSLIDTYKNINTIYYEERDARRAARAKEKAKNKSSDGDVHDQSHASVSKKPSGNTEGQGAGGSGATNNGWDDENYDYIITAGELFYGRYRIKERIGKGSFGQVVRAEDTQEQKDVAIKIIKSKKPFLMQAKTEIELLTHLNEKDMEDQHNIVRLLTHFMYRNHQCLVFEMLSLNLYELLKNTQFGGVSLNLIRKFAKQVLKSLSFLARKDVDVIHCDLKPENILLRHPKKSGIKVIDFGSSCRSNRRMYSYIQSRFYRSPEVMLGLPYAVSIDMWSLGCILAEMHTGEPLFSGSDQFDQMQKIVKILGMVPSSMLDKANDTHRLQFFERVRSRFTDREEWNIKQHNTSSSSRGGSSSASKQQPENAAVVIPSTDPIASLSKVIRTESHRKKKYPPSETGNSPRNYQLFVDLIYRMLAYDPAERIKAQDALNHPFIAEQIK